jgi:hypothetical protein
LLRVTNEVPGLAVFTLDRLTTLTQRPESHAPTAVNP